MISFEEFEKLFQPILDENIRWEKECNLLEQLYPHSYVVPEGGKLLDDYIELLSKYVDDKNEVINFYCWECDFGKKKQTMQINGYTPEIINNLYDVWYLLYYGFEKLPIAE